MRYKLPLYLIFFILCTKSKAQNSSLVTIKQGQALIDSLLTELPKSKQDINKVNILNTLSDENSLNGSYDTAHYFALQAKVLAEKLNFQKGIAYAYYNIANVNLGQANYPDAFRNHSIALKIRNKIGDKKDIADSYDKIGRYYSAQGNDPEALKNYFISLKISEAIGYKLGIATSYNNIGNVNYTQGNYPDGLKYMLAGLKIFEDMGYKYGIATIYSNIGNIYGDLGNYIESLKNHFAALKISQAISDNNGIAATYNNIAAVYYEQKNFTLALKNFFAASKIIEAIGDKNAEANTCHNIGQVYLTLNKILLAKKWEQKALKLSLEIGAIDITEYSYKMLATADSALGNYKGAFENNKLYMLYHDSLFNKENTKKLTQTEMQYGFDKKQLADSITNKEIQHVAATKLQKQKTYSYAGIGIALLLTAFSLYIFRSNKKLSIEKQKSEDLLLNILPSEVAQELKENGSSAAKHYDDVTVLFTDFVGFTLLSEKLSPQQLVNELHQCFKAFDEIISKHNIEKIKTIGDAYLAVAGLPIANEKHAQNVVNAALEINSFMVSRKQQLGDMTFGVRIGVNSGSIVAGIVGVKKFAYDIWGDTVNTAARMEQNGEAGKVNISQSTYELVKNDFSVHYRGKINAKNKGDIDMYFVEKNS